jgi:hypothetical protein
MAYALVIGLQMAGMGSDTTAASSPPSKRSSMAVSTGKARLKAVGRRHQSPAAARSRTRASTAGATGSHRSPNAGDVKPAANRSPSSRVGGLIRFLRASKTHRGFNCFLLIYPKTCLSSIALDPKKSLLCLIFPEWKVEVYLYYYNPNSIAICCHVYFVSIVREGTNA